MNTNILQITVETYPILFTDSNHLNTLVHEIHERIVKHKFLANLLYKL